MRVRETFICFISVLISLSSSIHFLSIQPHFCLISALPLSYTSIVASCDDNLVDSPRQRSRTFTCFVSDSKPIPRSIVYKYSLDPSFSSSLSLLHRPIRPTAKPFLIRLQTLLPSSGVQICIFLMHLDIRKVAIRLKSHLFTYFRLVHPEHGPRFRLQHQQQQNEHLGRQDCPSRPRRCGRFSYWNRRQSSHSISSRTSSRSGRSKPGRPFQSRGRGSGFPSDERRALHFQSPSYSHPHGLGKYCSSLHLRSAMF